MIEYVSIPQERIRSLRKDDRWKQQLSKLVDAKITFDEDVCIECGDPLLMIRLIEVVKAFGRGFDFNDSLSLLDESYRLEIIDIKEFAGKSKNRQSILRSRVIGREGTIKKTIEKRFGVKVAVYGKTVAVICKDVDSEKTMDSIVMILSGSKFGTVTRFLREHQTL